MLVTSKTGIACSVLFSIDPILPHGVLEVSKVEEKLPLERRSYLLSRSVICSSLYLMGWQASGAEKDFMRFEKRGLLHLAWQKIHDMKEHLLWSKYPRPEYMRFV